jgi:hypothetical protein
VIRTTINPSNTSGLASSAEITFSPEALDGMVVDTDPANGNCFRALSSSGNLAGTLATFVTLAVRQLARG